MPYVKNGQKFKPKFKDFWVCLSLIQCQGIFWAINVFGVCLSLIQCQGIFWAINVLIRKLLFYKIKLISTFPKYIFLIDMHCSPLE